MFKHQVFLKYINLKSKTHLHTRKTSVEKTERVDRDEEEEEEEEEDEEDGDDGSMSGGKHHFLSY